MTLIVTPPYSELGLDQRALRLISLSGQAASIGFWEFEIYDALGNNLCRVADFAPLATASSGASSGVDLNQYPPQNSIDGMFGSDWRTTCYIAAKSDGSSYLEYTFKRAISAVRWRVMCEGSWLPNINGIKLMRLVNENWIDVPSALVGGASWSSGVWKEFNVQF